MARFASVADLAAYTGETIADDDPTALLMLELASGAVQGYTGQTIERVVDDEVTVYGTGSDVLYLPELPVESIAAVTLDETALTTPADYGWNAAGLLLRPSLWPAKRAVVVRYTHGYMAVPDDIRGVVLQAAGRAFINPGTVLSEGIGTYNVTYARSVGVELTQSELMVLDRYRFHGIA